jgi:hypothetical protein
MAELIASAFSMVKAALRSRWYDRKVGRKNGGEPAEEIRALFGSAFSLP